MLKYDTGLFRHIILFFETEGSKMQWSVINHNVQYINIIIDYTPSVPGGYPVLVS